MTVPAQDDRARWLRRPPRTTPADARLFCFHHAGGAASFYREWPDLVPPGIEPVAVQLPGRADRLREPPFEAMGPLVDALVPVLDPLLDRPFGLFGLSMGAYVAWALAHRLRERARPLPVLLCVASAAEPGWPGDRVDWAALAADPTGFLGGIGGTPPELLADPGLVDFLLPILRADLTVLDTLRLDPTEPLDLPIRAFAGTDDAEGEPGRMAGWCRRTRGRFALDVVSGGHFFDAAGLRRVIGAIAEELLPGPA